MKLQSQFGKTSDSEEENRRFEKLGISRNLIYIGSEREKEKKRIFKTDKLKGWLENDH